MQKFVFLASSFLYSFRPFQLKFTMPNHLSRDAELKSEGAIEAAADPNSAVSAGDAEKAIVNETKKAGGVAFQFDPDASPEEKAAQARSVGQPSSTMIV